MSVAHSVYDSRRFGLAIYRSRCDTLDDIQAAIEQARELGAQLLIVRFPTEQVDSFRWFDENARWFFGDALVHYKKRCRDAFPEREVEGFRIRMAERRDIPEIEQIADQLFGQYSSHYRCNPKTRDGSKLSAGYAEWAVDFILNSSPSRYCLLVETTAGVLAGYISGELRGNSGHVVIGGIRPQFQKHGLYKWMLERWFNDLKEVGAEHVEFSTQIQNTAVQKVWSRLGFEIFASEYTLHVDLEASSV